MTLLTPKSPKFQTLCTKSHSYKDPAPVPKTLQHLFLPFSPNHVSTDITALLFPLTQEMQASIIDLFVDLDKSETGRWFEADDCFGSLQSACYFTGYFYSRASQVLGFCELGESSACDLWLGKGEGAVIVILLAIELFELLPGYRRHSSVIKADSLVAISVGCSTCSLSQQSKKQTSPLPILGRTLLHSVY